MKSDVVNEVLDSLSESIGGIDKDGAKPDYKNHLYTDKHHQLIYIFDGDVDGIIGFGFDDELADKEELIVKAMDSIPHKSVHQKYEKGKMPIFKDNEVFVVKMKLEEGELEVNFSIKK